jgi:hypothetical protein
MRVGELAVWRVDGHWVRDRVDVEFTNGAHDLIAPYVPRGEIWIDREAPGAGAEWRFWALYQMAHRRGMARGATYLEALARAERIERAARRVERVGTRRELRRLALRGRPRIVDGQRVYLVRGRMVRDHAFVHFTQGGHPLRYRFIPAGEIWIDDAVAPAERAAVVHHELVELRLMRDEGLAYAPAHELASASERRLRRPGAPASGRAGGAA